MRNLWILFLCLVILCSGCSMQSYDFASSGDSVGQSAPMIEEKTAIEGFSIEELGFDIKADIDFVDPNLKYDRYSTYGTISGNSDNIMGDFAKDDLLGWFTYLYIQTVETKLSVTEIPIKYLQGFKISDLNDANHIIRIKSNNYTWEDLKKYEVYHDSSVVIFDFTDFIMTESYEEYLKNYDTGWAYDFSWTKDVYQYFKEHIKECFIPLSSISIP